MSTFESLQARFPRMTPTSGPPPMVRINGVGLTVMGTRDRDAETGTYVTTLTFTLLFLPVLALAAFRVADAPTGGQYFLGREPLSGLAKGWNALVGFLFASFAALLVVGMLNSGPPKAPLQAGDIAPSASSR